MGQEAATHAMQVFLEMDGRDECAVDVGADDTVADLYAHAAAELQADDDAELWVREDDGGLRRLKDRDETVKDVGLVDGTTVHVRLGQRAQARIHLQDRHGIVGDHRVHMVELLRGSRGEADLERLRLLLQAGVMDELRAEENPLLSLCEHGWCAGVQVCLDEGLNPTMCFNKRTKSPMFFAAAGGHTDVVRCVAEHVGPDGARMLANIGGHAIDAMDTSLLTPLMAAAQHGHLGCVRVLLRCGADKNARQAGRTAAMTAAYNKHAAVMAELLSPDIVTQEDDTGRTVLTLCLQPPRGFGAFATVRRTRPSRACRGCDCGGGCLGCAAGHRACEQSGTRLPHAAACGGVRLGSRRAAAARGGRARRLCRQQRRYRRRRGVLGGRPWRPPEPRGPSSRRGRSPRCAVGGGRRSRHHEPQLRLAAGPSVPRAPKEAERSGAAGGESRAGRRRLRTLVIALALRANHQVAAPLMQAARAGFVQD